MWKWMPYPKYTMGKYASGLHGTFNCEDHVTVKIGN